MECEKQNWKIFIYQWDVFRIQSDKTPIGLQREENQISLTEGLKEFLGFNPSSPTVHASWYSSHETPALWPCGQEDKSPPPQRRKAFWDPPRRRMDSLIADFSSSLKPDVVGSNFFYFIFFLLRLHEVQGFLRSFFNILLSRKLSCLINWLLNMKFNLNVSCFKY